MFLRLLRLFITSLKYRCDFSETQIKKGFVSSLFNKKQKDYFIQIKKVELGKQLENTKAAIERAKREQLESFDEWKIEYEKRKLEISQNHSSWQPQYKEKLNELEELSIKRKAAIQSRLNNDIPILEQNMLDVKTAIARVSNESLKELITNDNADKIFSVSVKNDDTDEKSSTILRKIFR